MFGSCFPRNKTSAFRRLAALYTVVLGVLALLDAHNGYTVPIYAWLLLVTGDTAVLMVGLLVASFQLLRHSDKKSFVVDSEEAEREGLMPKGKSPSDAIKQQLYMHSVTVVTGNFVFFALVFLTSLLAFQQAMFVYDYTKSKDGYQAALDGGFPTGNALYFAPFMKLQLMFQLEMQMVVAIGICFVSAAVRRSSKHQHSA